MNRSARRSICSLVTAVAICLGNASPALADSPTVLGLDASDDAADLATSLTTELRNALVARGNEPGADMTLLELNLTLDCGEEDFVCLAEGGSNLGASELVYGSLRRNGDQAIVTLTRLIVESKKLESTVRKPISVSELENDASAVATGLIAELWNEEMPVDEPAAAPASAADEADEADETEGPKDNNRSWEWGKDPSPPTWKWIGLGVSGGLAAASLGTAVVTTLMFRNSVRDDLLAAADDSLTDDNSSNDIDRLQLEADGIDLCVYAAEEINPDEPGAVRNASVTKLCDKGNALATTATASWVATGVFTVSTAVFTTLLFTRKKSETAAALQRHGVTLGGTPLPGGGAMVGGGFRF